MAKLTRPSLNNLRPFEPELPDLPIDEIKRRLGTERVAKLSFNENPYGPSPRAIEAMHKELTALHLYQDASGDALRATLARDLGVGPDQLILTNGADELILLTTLAFLDPGEEVIIPSPTFGQYAASTMAMGAKPLKVPLRDFRIDVNAILEQVTPRTKMVFVCNPNNPTGTIVSRGELAQLMQELHEDILLVVDEAYVDYVTDPSYNSALDFLRSRKALLIIRTFSKLHGLASARVGFGIGHASIIDSLQRVRPPFNVNRIGQVGALASWQDVAYQDTIRDLNTENRQYLYDILTEHKLSYIPSETNFVLVDTHQEAATVYKRLAKAGIIVRDAALFGLPRHLRITVGRKEDMLWLGETL
ncbi:MAG: histidinol-phosphate transaminase [Firmicutes bacterium]|nr:histidinol-phosphate transaminase [Bacillota bacterium]